MKGFSFQQFVNDIHDFVNNKKPFLQKVKRVISFKIENYFSAGYCLCFMASVQSTVMIDCVFPL